ncbi:sigma-70 family RNA polymerase sigma factor [Frigoriglobus tundricola]|uniref:RNA polymerase sigma factor 70 region 4 type 2 domain-containing protein n=1 Tax=Frigoriglobus tundricola TaxID=2774151 RepID=A0A6M5Z6T4_9BACT|nr:sigma-70 family RNA polymerase sigma factor [Frigoriglobus tundricola]QJX01342.1 hypothetical protein FTUN_8986 [Frigoriglobus tundricola]
MARSDLTSTSTFSMDEVIRRLAINLVRKAAVLQESGGAPDQTAAVMLEQAEAEIRNQLACLLVVVLRRHVVELAHKYSGPRRQVEVDDLLDHTITALLKKIEADPTAYQNKTSDDWDNIGRTFVFNNVRNLAHKLVRGNDRNGWSTDELENVGSKAAPISRLDLQDEVRACRRWLKREGGGSPQDLLLFDLLYEGLDEGEIAEVLNLERGTVYQRFHRLRERFERYVNPRNTHP